MLRPQLDDGGKYKKFIARDANGKSDVYDILRAYDVHDPAVQHAIKKLLMPGRRGAKDVLDDLREARVSLDNAINAAARNAPPTPKE